MLHPKVSEWIRSQSEGRLEQFVFLLVYSAVAVMLLAVVIYFAKFSSHPIGNAEEWGQFGDFFGGLLNPIIGLCSLCGILIAVLLQKKQLEVTRFELEETKKALQESAESQKKAVEASAMQSNAARVSLNFTTLTAWLQTYRERRNMLMSQETIGMTEEDEVYRSRAKLDETYEEVQLILDDAVFALINSINATKT